MDENDFIQDIIDALQEAIESPGQYSTPNPSMVTFYRNLKDRKLWLDDDIGQIVVEYAKLILRWNEEDAGKPVDERKPIKIYIFSDGGNADNMWMFLDMIAASETPVWTINVGKCWSAAALIFMAGHKRIMMSSSTVLIHEGSGMIAGDAIKVMDQADSYRQKVKKMHGYIISHTSIPAAMLTKKKNNDWELDSGTCLKYGVCDSVANTMSDIM